MSNSTSDAPERWSWERDRMEKHPNGFWVQASDYDSLQSQLTAARAENVNHVDQLNRLIQERNEMANKLALAPNQRVHQQSDCVWTLTPSPDYEVWESGCGESWQFENEGPKENRMKFCPYCSKSLREVIVEVKDDDDE